MKKVIIKDKLGVSNWSAELADPTDWIAHCVSVNVWGKPERWVLHKDEPMAESYDDADVLEEELRELTPAVEAVMELVSPAVEAKEAVLDSEGAVLEPAVEAQEAVYAEISPAVPAVMQKWVKLKSEYTVSIEDITAQVAQEAMNAEALAYLASTDWLIIREMDSGTPCPEDIKQKRAEARSKIVR